MRSFHFSKFSLILMLLLLMTRSFRELASQASSHGRFRCLVCVPQPMLCSRPHLESRCSWGLDTLGEQSDLKRKGVVLAPRVPSRCSWVLVVSWCVTSLALCAVLWLRLSDSVRL